MFLFITFMFAFIHFNVFLCVKSNDNNYYDIYHQDDSYRGEKFPQKYLSTDGVQPTMADFSYYVKSLSRVVDYFYDAPNETDSNIALGSFLTKAVLKRTLINYSHKMKEEEKYVIRKIINKAEDIASHFIYYFYGYRSESLGFRFSRLLAYDDSLIYSIEEYKKNAMKKWINSNIKLHEFVKEMDDISLPKDEYAKYVTNMDNYYLINDSDKCLSHISLQPIPLKKDDEMKPCHHDFYCKDKVLKMPSIAYALSHRMLYILLLAQTRRCYIVSEEADKMHMDIMCANMYRETVYMARRGYFYKDLFLEHIALCALLGYEEFHRHNWFQKSAGWVDVDGCVVENRNFELNRTKIYISNAKTKKEVKAMKKLRYMHVNDECHHHQMVLTMVVLATGIRHAAHYMNNTL